MKAIYLLIILAIGIPCFSQNATSYIRTGNQYYKQSKFDMAEGSYRKALELEPNNTTAQYNLANALQKQKKFQEAVEVDHRLFTNATETKVKEGAAYNEGVGYTKQKMLEQSIESYKNALRIDPNDQQARENLQKALNELKKKQQDQQKQQQKSSSSMDQNDADQKLKLLDEKEKQLQQKLQKQKKQQGGGGSRDW